MERPEPRIVSNAFIYWKRMTLLYLKRLFIPFRGRYNIILRMALYLHRFTFSYLSFCDTFYVLFI